MSNIQMIIEERPAHIGNFMVGRLLPFKGKRMVGPFIFIDHMGPAEINNNTILDVGPHPHIGLSTLTYLFDGVIRHRDTLGTDIEIAPGQVNWMTAGKGIVHSERTPERFKASGTNMFLHGLQIWIALPKELEQMDPGFYHAGENSLPAWDEDGVHYKLIAGTYAGKQSPVPVYSPLFLLEVKVREVTTIQMGAHLFGEVGLYILQGRIRSDGVMLEPKQIIVAKENALCTFEIEADTIFYLFGGEAFPEGRSIFWNFVASDTTLIQKAADDWVQDKFPRISDEGDLVPMPPFSPNLRLK